MTTECALCGATGLVAVGLVEYAPPYPLGRRFDSIPRCRDRVDCRARVENSLDLAWPLAPTSTDALTASTGLLATAQAAAADGRAAAWAASAAPPETDLLDG